MSSADHENRWIFILPAMSYELHAEVNTSLRV